MIRIGTEKDAGAILEMGAMFWKETMYTEPYDHEHTRGIFDLAIDHGLVAVLDIDGVQGFVAGVKAPLLCSPTVLTGTEVAWWVNPEHRSSKNGMGLMLFIEDLAREQGIKYWNMISMESSNPDVANGIYDKLGYRKSETSWTKVI